MASRAILFFANTEWYLYNFRSALLEDAGTAGWSVSAVSPPGIYGQRLVDAGIDWQALPFDRDSRGGMLLSLWPTVSALRVRIRETRPSVVHSFTLTSILIAWLACPRSMSIRRVNAVTGMGYAFTGTSLVPRLLRAVLRPLIRRALAGNHAWTVVQNATDQAYLIQEFGLDPERVRLIPSSGVDVERFRPGPRTGPGFRVGFVGRLLTDKGIREYVAAAAQVRARFPDVEFVAAGAPDLGNPAAIDEKEREGWEQAGDVKFLGKVEDMPGFLQELDLFVLPSYREGLSRSLIEAGACGLPAVTTDVPGCRDVVVDGDNGLLVPPADSKRLAEAIQKLLEDSSKRNAMGARARRVVQEQFSNAVVNGATLALYDEVLEEHGGF